MDTLKVLNTLNAVNFEHGGDLNVHSECLNALNTLTAVNLEHGGAMNVHSECSEHSECSKHSECCEFGTWGCYEWLQ